MYGIYANIGGILMVNVTIYSIHGSYGIFNFEDMLNVFPTMWGPPVMFVGLDSPQ